MFILQKPLRRKSDHPFCCFSWFVPEITINPVAANFADVDTAAKGRGDASIADVGKLTELLEAIREMVRNN
jgi:hypothetical protein